MSACNNPRYQGPELSGDCAPVPGGTPTIQAPVFELAVTNPDALNEACDYLLEEDGQMVLEDNSDFLCVDNV